MITNDNRLYGWDGDILWQDDLSANSWEISQSYLITVEKYTVPAIDLISPGVDLKRLKAQNIEISNYAGNILRVKLTYTNGETVNPDDEEPVEEGGVVTRPLSERFVKSITSVSSTTSKTDNILAHPKLRKANLNGAAKTFLALLSNGTISRKINSMYGYRNDAYDMYGTISVPSNSTAKEFTSYIEQGINSYVYDDKNIIYTIRTKSPMTYISLVDMVGYIVDASNLPAIFKLDNVLNRNWLCDSVTVNSESAGIYSINVSFKMSNYGGWQSIIYNKDDN